MLTLSSKIRKEVGKKVKSLRQQGILPAVLYGHKIKNLNLEVDSKEFEKIYSKAGESSLITLVIAKGKDEAEAEASSLSLNVEEKKQKFLILIHDIQFDPLTEKPIHIDFYRPGLKEEVEVTIHLTFEGESKAVKNLGGTLIKEISEIEVKAKSQNLPHEIKVDIGSLKTFEDNIKISDLKVPEGVKILKGPEEIVVSISRPEKVEEELEKPVEEKVEEVEQIKKRPEEKEEEIKKEIK